MKTPKQIRALGREVSALSRGMKKPRKSRKNPSTKRPKSLAKRANPAKYGPKFARVYLEREPLDRGGYTRRGKYFGTGARLYRFTSDGVVDKYGRDTGVASASMHPDMEGVRYRDGYVDGHVRAADRKSAMAKIRAVFPNVRFSGKE
jgi:hypothetical protein